MTNRKVIFAGIIIILIIIGTILLDILPLGEIITDDKDLVDNDIENEGITLINKEGLTIEDRYSPVEGYTRIEYEEGTFGDFLRKQKLKPYGEKVSYYNGREKSPRGVYDSAFDVDIGERDLHQCADAIMLLRGEYLYSKGLYDEISFNFVSGFKAEYKKWMDGYRIKVQGNDVEFYQATQPSNTYEDFRKYMDMVFAYAGTLSLVNELESISLDEMDIGDVFIVGGSPGHAAIVVDMASNSSGEKIFLLAQSYMPAQQTQLLINPMNDDISPWYSLKGEDILRTPEFTFELNELKTWNEKGM